MFNVELNGQQASFTFAHIRGIGEEVRIKAATTCTLVIDGVTHTGIAACSIKDNFNREVGRKIALAHALRLHRKEKELSFDFRKVIWNRYHFRSFANDKYIDPVLPAKGFVKPQPPKLILVKK